MLPGASCGNGFRCPPFAFQATEGRQEEEMLNTYQPAGLQAGFLLDYAPEGRAYSSERGVKPAKLALRCPAGLFLIK